MGWVAPGSISEAKNLSAGDDNEMCGRAQTWPQIDSPPSVLKQTKKDRGKTNTSQYQKL